MSKIIAIEGVDYSGKSTLLSKLKTELQTKVDKVVKDIIEPGGSKSSLPIRSLLKEHRFSKETECYLHIAARQQLYNDLKPLLEVDKYFIISDRSVVSFLAYQKYLNEVNIPQELFEHKNFQLIPDLVIYLNIDYNTYLKRSDIRNDNDVSGYDNLTEVEFNKLTTAYSKSLAEFKDTKIINIIGDVHIDQLVETVLNKLN